VAADADSLAESPQCVENVSRDVGGLSDADAAPPKPFVTVSAPGAALARFQVSIYGRFWVSTEAEYQTTIPDRSERGHVEQSPDCPQSPSPHTQLRGG
jgi:hypothetical protein